MTKKKASELFEVIFDDEHNEREEVKKEKREKEKKVNSLKGKNKQFTLKNVDINGINTEYIKPDLTSKYQSSLGKDSDIKHLTSRLNKLQLSDFAAQPDEKLQIDIVKKNLYYSNATFIKGTTECWNCDTSDFPGIVLKLPYKYHPSVLEITGTIPGTEQVYKSIKNLTVKERIGWENKMKNEKKKGEDKLVKKDKEEKLIKREYFDVDGFFCRPGCLLRYYYEHRNENMYKNSLSLIRMMFKMMGMNQGKDYRSFPSKKMLKKKGGVLTLDEYYKTTTDDVRVMFFDTKQFIKDDKGNSKTIFEQVKAR
jgi:hypothetical protein